MAKYDLENLLDSIPALLKSKLNTKLAAIDAEKNDGLTLSTVDNAAYFFQELNGTTANYDPFIYYGLEDIQTVGIGPVSSDSILIACVIVFADSGQDVAIGARLLRYMRALKEVFEEDWASNTHGVKISISSLAPEKFKLANSSKFHRGIGVLIKADMAL